MIGFSNIDPTALSNKELNKVLKEAWHSASGNYKSDAIMSFLIAEMNRRQSKATARLSLLVSSLALVIALTAAIFSYLDWKSDMQWQNQQIGLLTQIANKEGV